MATMDIIKYFMFTCQLLRQEAGGAGTAALNNTSDPAVKGVLVNIFVMLQCDVIAKGIVAAARNVNIEVPLVVRLGHQCRGWKTDTCRKRAGNHISRLTIRCSTKDRQRGWLTRINPESSKHLSKQ